jgi:hypothetical protein
MFAFEAVARVLWMLKISTLFTHSSLISYRGLGRGSGCNGFHPKLCSRFDLVDLHGSLFGGFDLGERRGL